MTDFLVELSWRAILALVAAHLVSKACTAIGIYMPFEPAFELVVSALVLRVLLDTTTIKIP